MESKLELSTLRKRGNKIVYTLYVCQNCVLVLFNYWCISCLYWVGSPLALNAAPTLLCIESHSSINVFLSIEYHTEDTCAHKVVLQFDFFHVFFHNVLFSCIRIKSVEFQGQALTFTPV